jgi:two-component system, response regulator PdtaR
MIARRVLIIEDEALIALLFEEVLAELGHEVCASERTQAGAITAAALCKPDLIISDIRLQDGNGLDAVTAILKTGFIPHIFVSGNTIDRKTLNPAAEVLQKPFDERQLIQAIQRAIEPANVLVGQKYADDLHAA